jgi:hypothetical protein
VLHNIKYLYTQKALLVFLVLLYETRGSGVHVTSNHLNFESISVGDIGYNTNYLFVEWTSRILESIIGKLIISCLK